MGGIFRLYSSLSSGLNTSSRCFRVCLTLSLMLISVMYLVVFREDPSILRDINAFGRKPPAECTFPSTDPFDPALEKVIKIYPPLDCSSNTANIVYLDDYVLKLNHSKLRLVLSPTQKFSHCRYKEITRKKGIDTGFEYTWFSQNFSDFAPLPLWHDNVVSECFATNGKVISRSYFPLIRKKPQVEEYLNKNYQAHVEKNSPTETLSIFMIGIDGMSKQNFERSQPKTRKFLLEKMGAIELYKYNKLAFETFPNVLALLTGHTPEEFYKHWHYNRTGFVDQINEAFLWADARKIGYRTGMILDCYDITAFHYQKRGFKVSPVDYYQRQTVIASSRDKLMRGNNSNCAGDMPEVNQVHDYWLQMARTFGKDRTTPFFAYSFAARLTHDESDFASKGDEAYHKFLQDLVATDALDNTVIVWFSDHGPRFGAIRETYHGRIETSTPYLFFTFPPWFERKYPQLIKTLKINQNRLSSHFDVYETLRDLLFLKAGKRPKGTVKERGISLFREIPRERTCHDAGIPDEFCACGKFFQPKVTRETLTILGITLLNKINSFTGHGELEVSNMSASSVESATSGSDSAGESSGSHLKFNTSSLPSPTSHTGQGQPAPSANDFRERCARLNLVRVESLYRVSNIQLHSLKADTYRVTIRLHPGYGLFEGLVNFERGQPAEVKGDIVRINMYRGQADCVHDPWLRQFCYCLV